MVCTSDFVYLIIYSIILCHLLTSVAIILIFFHGVIKDIELHLAKHRSLQNSLEISLVNNVSAIIILILIS